MSRAVTAVVKPLAGSLGPSVLLRIPVTRVVEVRSPYCDGPVFLDAQGVDPIASMLFWQGPAGWEPETVPIFLRLVQPQTTVLDIGANTGLFSLLAARHSRTTTVRALEPIPRVFGMLEANVARNALSNVVCHRLALSNKNGPVAMYVPPEDVPLMASLLSDWRPGSERIEVEGTTVDDFVSTENIKNLNLLKIDTEGTEDFVVEGARETLIEQQPFVICEVLQAGGTAERLAEQMSAAGYLYFLLSRDGPRSTNRVVGNPIGACPNYLFVPGNRLEEARTLLEL